MWDRLKDLELRIESASATTLRLEQADWARVTGIIALAGAGCVGEGEDTTYDPAVHEGIDALVARLPLAGTWTLGSFSTHLDGLDLHPIPPQFPGQEEYRRWGIESAALDLALQQAGTTLGAMLKRPLAPLQFAVSMSLSTPEAHDTFHAWHAQHPELRFKIDAAQDWTADSVARLAATGAVRVVDMKGHYVGDWIDNTPRPELYSLVGNGFDPASVLIEDPWLDDVTRPALGDAWTRRLSFDAPVHSVADLERLAPDMAWANIKPSRFGTIRELLAAISWCETNDVPMYAGGQYELGIGRVQAQEIARLFYPEAWNDLAPVAWHAASPGDPVPLPMLDAPAESGFGRIREPAVRGA